MKYKLGLKVKDKVTGHVGIITCYSKWLNGCVRYLVQGKVDKDGKVPEGEWVDEAQVEKFSEKVEVKQSRTGGPKRTPKVRNNA